MDGHAGGGAFAPREAPPRGTSPLPVRTEVPLLRPAVVPAGPDVGGSPRSSDVGVLPATAEPLRFF